MGGTPPIPLLCMINVRCVQFFLPTISDFTLQITKLFKANAIEHSFYSVMNKEVCYLFSSCRRLHMPLSNNVQSFVSHVKLLLIDRRVYAYALNTVENTSF